MLFGIKSTSEVLQKRVYDVFSDIDGACIFHDDMIIAAENEEEQTGLGVCIMQEGCPIAYVSWALTAAEQNYAQVEKKLLAICFAYPKFHQYIHVVQRSLYRPITSRFRL